MYQDDQAASARSVHIIGDGGHDKIVLANIMTYHRMSEGFAGLIMAPRLSGGNDVTLRLDRSRTQKHLPMVLALQRMLC